MQADKKTILRRCIDYLHKYGTLAQVVAIAQMLNIGTEEKKPPDSTTK